MGKKTWIVIGAIVAAAGGFIMYNKIIPGVQVTGTSGKNIFFRYGGKDYVYDFTNPLLALHVPAVRGFSLEVQVLGSGGVSFKYFKNGNVVSQNVITIQNALSGIYSML